MKVLELFQDIAGKWRARVDLGNESQFFKFQEKPTEEEIFTQAQGFLDTRRVAEEALIAEQQAKEQIIEDAKLLDPKDTTVEEAIETVNQLIETFTENGTTN